MNTCVNAFWLLAAGVLCTATSHAGDVVLPSDVAVTLSAEPTFGLERYQTIHFTLTVTNRGPEPIPLLFLSSSALHDEIITVYDGTSDCGLITSVADGPDDFWYYRTWYVTSTVPGDPPPLAAGETRTCHFTESLSYSAPAVTPYSFGMPGSWSDPEPSNNVATVYLHRAVAAATPVPTSSRYALILLMGALASVAARRRLAGD